VEALETKADIVLVDGNRFIDGIDIPQQTIIKGDYYSHVISAASVLAKDHYNKLIQDLDEQEELKYGWSSNAGCLTPRHQAAMKKHGLSQHHHKIALRLF
jgi:ribonuclease HII